MNVTNEPAILSGNGPAGYGDSGFGGALIAASLLDGKTAYYTAKAEADVKAMLAAEARQLFEGLADNREEIVKANYQNEAKIRESEISILKQIDYNSNYLKDCIHHVQTSMDRQFCEVKHDIESKFRDINERELKQEIRALRDAKNKAESDNQSASVVKAILDALAKK